MTIEECQRTREAQWSEELAKSIDQAFLDTLKLPFDELVSVYKDVENHVLAQLTGEEFLILETKRRIAEQKLHRAIDRECTLEACRQVLRDLLRLGFTDPSLKSTAYLSYATRCEETGHREEGVALLEGLERELEHNLQYTGPMLQDLLVSVRKRLAKMRQSESAQDR